MLISVALMSFVTGVAIGFAIFSIEEGPDEGKNLAECQIEDYRYVNILGKCYYIEKKMLSFYEAVENCKIPFGRKHSGKLFEPKSFEQNNQVHTAAKNHLISHHTWLNNK